MEEDVIVKLIQQNVTPEDAKRLLTVAEFSEMFGIGQATVRRLIKTHQIPSIKRGRENRIPLLAYLVHEQIQALQNVKEA